MTNPHQLTNPLQQLGECGQSVWLDYISRQLVVSGQLERLLETANVTGLTSNPTIFEKAIAEGTDYDQHIRQLLGQGVSGPDDVFLGIAISDIQRAADILRPVHDRTGGADGFVSLEVLPSLAHDTEGTVAFAADLWERVQRPNLMVKIPATPEGIPAIEQTLARGINVNVTLIFALSAYEAVINAYLTALETRQQRGEPLTVRSVASFFVSRVDTAVDPLLERLGNTELLGKAAIANAVLAYETFERHFRDDERFTPLAAAGAAVQRPLWASTSAKNPAYRDVLYAEALIGADTVDTMPPATVEAFLDHGIVKPDTVRADYAGAHGIMARLGEAGIAIDDVTHQLLVAGVASFADSYTQLIRVIAHKVDEMNGGFGRRQTYDLGGAAAAFSERLADEATSAVTDRIWQRDPNLWKPGDAAHAAVIGNRLGWLDVVGHMQKHVDRLLGLSDAMRLEEVRDAVLLGMGGSSLCPEVLRTAFGSAAVHPTLHVLDTTDPAAVAAVTAAVNPAQTIFIVSSKSGTTLETLSHFAHFWELVEASGIAEPGAHFIAVTDPGTPLATLAAERGFREVFENPPDIGGRYSALSFFGLVPAAVMGLDVETLLDRAAKLRVQCAVGVPSDLNCGTAFGTALGLLHDQGRDKVTILTSPRLGAFSLWAEQLIAESTGKEGTGLIPIGAEPAGAPAVYGDDRVFVAVGVGEDGDAGLEAQIAPLRATGQPLITLTLNDIYDLGAEFFRWEFATAVAGAHLGIDPFDEPNVQESKDNTKRVLSTVSGGKLDGGPAEPPTATIAANGMADGGMAANGMADSGQADGSRAPGGPANGALDDFLNRQIRRGDYVALMAYIAPDPTHEAAVQKLRVAIRDRYTVATTLGFGPRFLHSTGQLHKGGPGTGVFIQLTAPAAVDVAIPGQPFGFAVLEQAQARGDLEALRSHGRRVIHLDLGNDVSAGIAALTESIHRTAGASH